MWDFLQNFVWVINSVFVYSIVRFIAHDMHFNFSDALKSLLNEFKDLAEKQVTMGAINALSIIVVLIFGFLIYVAYEFKLILKVVFLNLPERSSALMESSITLNMLLLCVMLISIASWVFVYLDNRS